MVMHKNLPECRISGSLSLDFHDAALADGDGHAGLHGVEERLSEPVYDGHGRLGPDIAEDRARGGKGVDALREEQACRLDALLARHEQHHAARGRADRHRQAQRLAEHGFFVDVGVVLVAALDLFISELHCHLVGGEGVEAASGDERLGCAGAGNDDAAGKSFHFRPSRFVVMRSRISASV